MLGKPVPDFSLASTDGTTFSSAAAREEKLVLFFHPEDNTPACTQQAADFRDRHEACRRAAKLNNLYGKKVRGIERSAFVVDANGVLARAWRGVKVPGHVEEVLNFVKAL